MLSTAQALRRWEAVIDLLARVKARDVACPAQPVPIHLQQQLEDALDAIQTGFTPPASTWTQLLQQKVRGTNHNPLNPALLVDTMHCAASAAASRRPYGTTVHCHGPSQMVASAASLNSSRAAQCPSSCCHQSAVPAVRKSFATSQL